MTAVAGLVAQNGNAYEIGLLEFWNPVKKHWATGHFALDTHGAEIADRVEGFLLKNLNR